MASTRPTPACGQSSPGRRQPHLHRRSWPSNGFASDKPRRPRLDWASLHKRTFGIDVLRCPCCGRRTVHAVHLTQRAAEERQAALGLAPPPRPGLHGAGDRAAAAGLAAIAAPSPTPTPTPTALAATAEHCPAPP